MTYKQVVAAVYAKMGVPVPDSDSGTYSADLHGGTFPLVQILLPAVNAQHASGGGPSGQDAHVVVNPARVVAVRHEIAIDKVFRGEATLV